MSIGFSSRTPPDAGAGNELRQLAAGAVRYETLRTLGQGSAGAVYLARDRETGEQIALKKLLRMDPKSVLRLKREFRALADVHHPNLVKLYDLGADDDGWFITMEYVDGPDLLRHLGRDPDRSFERDLASTRDLPADGVWAAAVQPTVAAFHQLACAIRALHDAGMLHRDLKPSNVLVSEGRVIVLDFGLVRELDGESLVVTQDGVISGTPAYMAPEQALGQPLGEVADWYAFGVMLYQALSGELPIEGQNAMELVMRKTSADPLPLERVAPHVPRALCALCDRLLLRDPSARPSGEEVVLILSREGMPSARPEGSITAELSVHEPRGRAPAAALFGRELELSQLRAAAGNARQGDAEIVHVRGASGAGKSALVEHFLAQLEQESRDELVLRSRCYEREAMPFKALDGVMDALVRYIAELDDFTAGHLLPADVVELAQLFPVLQRLPGVQRMLENAKPRGDALQVRRRAETALTDLFERLTARRPLVLWIDDLQWGDLDSANILRSWSDQLAQLPMTLVLSYRSDEVATSPCLRTLLERQAAERLSPRARERAIDLAPLDESDVHLLCANRLGELAQRHPSLIGQIASEARGNPFLVSQLAALVRAKVARGERELSALSIEQLVIQASELLPAEAREILNCLAIAGRPLLPRLALRAAGVSSEGRSLMHALRGLRLIRTRDIGGEMHIEVYHDRVREGVQAALSEAERARVHDQLLGTLEEENDSDADFLHTLALGAGKHELALRQGLIAADRANSALAFERAADLYQTCLALLPPNAAESGGLWLQRARALSRCRRGVEAAEAYLEAAKRAASVESVQLLRLASSHLVRCGEIASGEAIVGEVLSALKLQLPESDLGTMAAIGWERLAIGVRGLEFERRAAHEVPAQLLRNIDIFVPLSIENQAHHPLRAALLQARSLRWALEAGEPWRVARALCMSATMSCVSGSARSARQSAELLRRASAIAADLRDELLEADVKVARSVCALLLGRPDEVLQPSYEAERVYRADSRRDAEAEYYHLFTAVTVRIGALNALGEYRRAIGELNLTLQEARATNNRNIELQLTLCQSFADEIQLQSVRSKRRLEGERQLLPRERFGLLQLLHMLAVLRTACSTHDYAWAEPMLREDWPRWQRSPVRETLFFAMVAHSARVRFLLNQHVLERRSGDPAALVRADLRGLSRLPFPDWCGAVRCRVLARLAFLRGDRGSAAAHLRDAMDHISRTGAAYEAARDRYALGFVLGGEEGAALRAEADRFLRGRGFADPLADLHANYPELVCAP